MNIELEVFRHLKQQTKMKDKEVWKIIIEMKENNPDVYALLARDVRQSKQQQFLNQVNRNLSRGLLEEHTRRHYNVR